MPDFEEYKNKTIIVHKQTITVTTAIRRITGEMNEPDGKKTRKSLV